MNFDDACEVFSKWYQDCLENGIDPNDVIRNQGGMYLLTNEDVIDKLQDQGII